MFGKISITKSTGNYSDEIKRLKKAIEEADAVYACVNYGEAFYPENIRERAICINGDIGTVIDEINTCCSGDHL